MAINLRIGTDSASAIEIKVGDKTINEDVQIKLNARRNLAGDIMIFDHDDIDIVIMDRKKKIVAFAKEHAGEQVYEAQDRLFRYLTKKGIVDRETVQGGNVHASLEAKIQESKDYNSLHHALLSIEGYINKEKPYADFEKAFEQEEERRLTAPLPDESTEFDPARHAQDKGSVKPMIKYGISSIYRL